MKIKNFIQNENTLVISIIIITAISSFLYINQPDQHGNPPLFNAMVISTKVFYSLITSLYVLVAIRLIRGKVKKSNKPPYMETDLSVWDYIWRYFVVAWLASFSLIASLFLPMSTIFGKAVFTLIFAVLIPVIVLVLFGENRIDKLKTFIAYFYLR